MIELRALHDPAEFEQVVDLEIAIWQMPAREAVPASMLHAVAHAGGLVAGAFEGEHMVGMALCFLAQGEHGPFVWSHMAGVIPERQGQNIGFRLKQFQRQWALDCGLKEMRWTFDPLQRGNANFNLRHLGCTSNIYHVNFYGLMNDALNRDMPTDRLEVIWNLTASKDSASSLSFPPSDSLLLLTRGDDGMPVFHPPSADINAAISIGLTVPSASLLQSSERKLAWRLALREAFLWAFSRGFHAVDFVSPDNSAYGHYILQRDHTA